VKKNSIKIILILAVILGMLFSGFAAYASSDGDKDIEYLKSVMDMIKDKYKGEITDQQLIEGALKGMFNTMDPYTTYFTPEQADSFLNSVGGTYEGIGISMEKKGDYITVVKIFPSSPAEKAGLLPGDKITAVGEKSLIGASTEEAASLIKGPAGTKVTLGIVREGKSDILKIEVSRAKIKLNPVSYEIKGDIGYIKLETFNSNASEYINQALNEMDSKKITKIILDLRNNPGGEVTQAVLIARKFVPEGLITKLDFKSESVDDQVYYSYLQKPKYKLAVLVNGMTASASEILAGAIKDTDAGTLIGTKTFGKAKVQNLVPLLTAEAYKKYEEQLGVKVVDAYELMGVYGITPTDDEIIGWSKITTGTYTTPKGRMIDGRGLSPNIAVPDPELVDGIDIYSIQKLTKTSKPGLNDEGADVYNAEKMLKVLGYDVDAPDTVLDKKTFNAIWKFRADSKLYPGGTLDFSTQGMLNDKLDEAVMKLDKQYAKAVEVLNKP